MNMVLLTVEMAGRDVTCGISMTRKAFRLPYNDIISGDIIVTSR